MTLNYMLNLFEIVFISDKNKENKRKQRKNVWVNTKNMSN